ALVATGFSYDPAERGAQTAVAARLAPRIRDLRRSGAASLDLAWVAAGRVDAYTEVMRSQWDWSAGALLVTEAGGRVSWTDHQELVASGPAIHDALLALLQDAHEQGETIV
ncbi:MAG TPA: inositol monophosphatase family protein, partial [Candidatus Limnocylindria bacterium]